MGGVNSFLIVLIVLGALATAAVLVRGLFVLASGKDTGGRKSNQLMFARVGLQALTVLFVIMLLLLMRQGG